MKNSRPFGEDFVKPRAGKRAVSLDFTILGGFWELPSGAGQEGTPGSLEQRLGLNRLTRRRQDNPSGGFAPGPSLR